MNEHLAVDAAVLDDVRQDDFDGLEVLAHEYLTQNVVPLGVDPLDRCQVVAFERVLEHLLDDARLVQADGFLKRRFLEVRVDYVVLAVDEL